MIIRIWRTKVQSGRAHEYETFAHEQSLPMFHKQQGFIGVFFLGKDENRQVLTIWKDMSSVDALATSSTYQETAGKLGASGILVGDTSVEVFEVQSGDVKVKDLEYLLSTGE